MSIHSEKVKAGILASRERFAKQVIHLDGTDANGKPIVWTIRRADEMNWEIQKNGKFSGYYGRITAAFEALPAKMLSEAAQNSLESICESLRAIKINIQVALQDARKL